MFEVTAYGDYLEELYDEANYLEVTVSANADPDMAFIVIHSADSVHWNILPADDYLVGKNGNVSLKLYDLGAVAFLVEAEEAVDAETAVQSPN